jgi:hypothetical protein
MLDGAHKRDSWTALQVLLAASLETAAVGVKSAVCMPHCGFARPPCSHPTGNPCDEKFPVVVSTYEIVMADIKALARYNWKYIVVDEGHRLKNFNCKLIRDLKTLPTDNKLLLTGVGGHTHTAVSPVWCMNVCAM